MSSKRMAKLAGLLKEQVEARVSKALSLNEWIDEEESVSTPARCECEHDECSGNCDECQSCHRPDLNMNPCQYCGEISCDYDCDESQAGGFNPELNEALGNKSGRWVPQDGPEDIGDNADEPGVMKYVEDEEEEKDVSVYDALNSDDIDEQDNERFETDNYDSELYEQARNGERERKIEDESEGMGTCRSCGHEECEGWMRSGKCARCPKCEAEGNAPKDLDESINEISSDAPSSKRFGGLDSHPDHSDTDMECPMCGEVYDSEDAEYHASHLRGHKAKADNKSFVGKMNEQLSPDNDEGDETNTNYTEDELDAQGARPPIDLPDWERDEWGKIIDPDFPDDADKEFRQRGREEQERYHGIDLGDLDNEKETEQDLFVDDDGYGGEPYTYERPMKYESVKRVIRDVIRETYIIKGKKSK